MSKKRSYIIFNLIISTLICFLYKLLETVWSGFSHHSENKVILFSALLFTSIVVGLVLIILNKTEIEKESMYAPIIKIGLFLFFISVIIGYTFDPFEIFFPRPYTGLYALNETEDSEGNIGTAKIPQYIFESKSPFIKNEETKILDDYNDVNQKGFIFWQTAYVAGYNPKYITSFKKENNTEYFFTTGLLIGIEGVYNNLFTLLIYFIVIIILLLFNKPFVFSSFDVINELTN